MSKSFGLIVIVVSFLLFSSYDGDSKSSQIDDDSKAATFEVCGTEIIMTGIIDSTTEEKLFSLLKNNPSITTLVLRYVPGSSDDEANLKLGRRVKRSGLITKVPDYKSDQSGESIEGFIASGGVDLFLAGTTRILGNNACVGVHSWSDSDGTNANELDSNHHEHSIYINYYADIGFPNSYDFYFFTINSAPADGMHFMTPSELNKWQISPNIQGSCTLEDEEP